MSPLHEPLYLPSPQALPSSQGPKRKLTVDTRGFPRTLCFVASHHYSVTLVHASILVQTSSSHPGSCLWAQDFDTRLRHPRHMRPLISPGCILSVVSSSNLFNHLCLPWRQRSLCFGVLGCKLLSQRKASKWVPRSFSEFTSSIAWLCSLFQLLVDFSVVHDHKI